MGQHVLDRREPMKARTLWALLALCAAHGAQAEMYRCQQPDGVVRFGDLPCTQGEMPEAAPPRVPPPGPAARPALPPATVVERPLSVPPHLAVAPAVPAGEAPAGALTRRKREVLDLTAQLERCRADAPGFAEKSAAVYVAWTRRHASVLSEHERLLAAKVRAGRRGEATLPLRQCSEDWLRSLEPLTRAPDPRFSSAEKTWQLFLGALLTGDRSTALASLAGRAEASWRERVASMSDDDLRRVAASIRGMKVQWGDDYEKEGLVADTGNRVVAIAFRSINEEWKIAEFGGAGPSGLPAH
jgi:hypothetical protein